MFHAESKEIKEIPEDKKIKSVVDFSGVTSATLGKETIDITGLCQKGKKCVLTNEAFTLLLRAQKKAHEKKYFPIPVPLLLHER